jgi:hypothetical protein
MNKKQLSTVYGFMGTQVEILKTKLDCDVMYGRVVIEGGYLAKCAIDTLVNEAIDNMIDDIKKYSNDISFEQMGEVFKRTIPINRDELDWRTADDTYIRQSINHITNVAECLFDTYITLTTR